MKGERKKRVGKRESGEEEEERGMLAGSYRLNFFFTSPIYVAACVFKAAFSREQKKRKYMGNGKNLGGKKGVRAGASRLTSPCTFDQALIMSLAPNHVCVVGHAQVDT